MNILSARTDTEFKQTLYKTLEWLEDRVGDIESKVGTDADEPDSSDDTEVDSVSIQDGHSVIETDEGENDELGDLKFKLFMENQSFIFLTTNSAGNLQEAVDIRHDRQIFYIDEDEAVRTITDGLQFGGDSDVKIYEDSGNLMFSDDYNTPTSLSGLIAIVNYFFTSGSMVGLKLPNWNGDDTYLWPNQSRNGWRADDTQP